jgi:hypothetical protein
LEVALRQELQDVLGQIQRLQGEVHRRQQRAELPEDVLTWEEDGRSPQPQCASVVGKETPKIVPKYLVSSRVLPTIGSHNSNPRQSPRQTSGQSGCHSARLHTVHTAAREVLGRHGPITPRLSQPPLPSLPWRACTAP